MADAKTEAEEARGFEENQDRILKLFKRAQNEGSLRIGAKTAGISVSKPTGAPAKPPRTK